MTAPDGISDPAAATDKVGADRDPRAQPAEMPTLQTLALAAVAGCLGQAPDSGGDAEPAELRWLRRWQAEAGPKWTDTLHAAFADPHPRDRGLVFLARQLRLSAFELLTVALAAAVEEEPLVGRMLAFVQAPLGGSRPALGLLAQAYAPLVPPEARPLDLLQTGHAVRSGLLQLQGGGTPLPEQTAVVPAPLRLALNGLDSHWPGMAIGPGSLPPVPLPPSIVAEAQARAKALAGAPLGMLVLRSHSAAERRAVAAEIAAALGLRPLFIETEELAGLTPWLALRSLLPVFCFELTPGERRQLPVLPFYRGPVLVATGLDGGVEASGGGTLQWRIPVPPADERRELWRQALGENPLIDELASDHRHSSGRIAHLGRLAHQESRLQGRERPLLADIAAAAWSSEGVGLENLATPMPEPIPDGALVVTPALQNELQALLLRCRARDGLTRGLGLSAVTRYQPGVRSLFIGPSGTGKTLAAGWLATRLGMPLYRVDMAAVTSKYIGETEKNLSQLLAQAEQAEVILLFDEADALFGKRTDVQQANDRFANAQTNYLLQRMESFDGIALLTSNSKSRFDAAFARRLDAIITFPVPGPQERRGLWVAHLGEEHGLDGGELNRLAAGADLTGGNIRNVVLAAAVLAQAAGRPIVYADIARALTSEYRKVGRQMPLELK